MGGGGGGDEAVGFIKARKRLYIPAPKPIRLPPSRPQGDVPTKRSRAKPRPVHTKMEASRPYAALKPDIVSL